MNKTKITEVLKTLSVESRLDIFIELKNCTCSTNNSEEVCMSDLSNKLGISLPNVQRHIRSLEEVGLVGVSKVSRTCYCNITSKGKEIINLLNILDE